MAKTQLSEAEQQLLEWFLRTYQQRTPPQELNEILPEYRVNWHEIRHQAGLLGLPSTDVTFRFRWAQIFEHHCRAAVNRMLVANREKRLPKMPSSLKHLMSEHGYEI